MEVWGGERNVTHAWASRLPLRAIFSRVFLLFLSAFFPVFPFLLSLALAFAQAFQPSGNLFHTRFFHILYTSRITSFFIFEFILSLFVTLIQTLIPLSVFLFPFHLHLFRVPFLLCPFQSVEEHLRWSSPATVLFCTSQLHCELFQMLQ